MKNSKKARKKRKEYERRRQVRIIKELHEKHKSPILNRGFRHRFNKIRASKVLGFLTKKGFKLYNIMSNTICIPEIFSFSENTDETISTIKAVFSKCTDPNTKEIIFDHSNCKKLDICASTVMDVIVMEAYKRNKELRLAGKLPENKKVCEMLAISGLLKHLEIENNVKKIDNIKALELIEGKECWDVATQITDYIISCLSTQDLTLSKQGRQRLSELVGEVLNNCKEHCGDELKEIRPWYTIGHFSKHCDNNKGEQYHYGELQLAIFNFGQTIYESLQASSKETQRKMTKLRRKHLKRGVNSKELCEETLWTLFALQDGVSRFKDLSKGKAIDRGTGTVKLIDHFQEMGGTASGTNHPIMSITSGNTNILFDGEYRLECKKKGNSEIKIIAFNKANDINFPPDTNKVRRIENYFPGTVIALKFYIDKEFIEKEWRV